MKAAFATLPRCVRRVFIWPFILCLIIWFGLQAHQSMRLCEEVDLDLDLSIESDVLEPPSFLDEQPVSQSCQTYQQEVQRRIELQKEYASKSFDLLAESKPNEPLTETDEYGIPRKIIFFHTSKKFTYARFLCAIESATRYNPNHSITLFVRDANDARSFASTWRKRINSLYPSIHRSDQQRIKIIQFNSSVFKGTPLQLWHESIIKLNTTATIESNIMSAYQLGVLWQHGGVAIDPNLISVNPIIDRIKGRSLAYWSEEDMGVSWNKIMRLRRHDPIVWVLMEEFLKDANQAARMRVAWTFNLNGILNWILTTFCQGQVATQHDLCKFDTDPESILFNLEHDRKTTPLRKTTPFVSRWTEYCSNLNEALHTSLAIPLSHDDAFVNSAWKIVMDTQCPAVIESFHPKSLLIFSESGCKSFNEAAQRPGTHTVDVRGIAANNDITATSNSSRSVNIPKRISFILYNEQFKNPRYLCSIESAARQNPHHEVVLYAKNITNFIESTGEWYRNTVSRNSHFRKQFQILELDWDSSFHGTPLESWWRRKVYKKSKWVNQNLGNAFRLSTLWKHGGVYLDMDIVSLNPVGHVGKVIGRQIKPDILNNAFFSFEARDPFVWLMMEEFVSGFDGTKWGRNGPRMVERTYTKNCKKDSSVFAGIWREKPIPTACDFKIVPPDVFYPIPFYKKGIFTEKFYWHCDALEDMSKRSIGLHWWNKGIKGTTVEVDTVLEGVMKAHCPALFDTWHPDELGFFTKNHLLNGGSNHWIGYEVADGF